MDDPQQPTVNEPRRFLAAMQQRYMNDPEFHARVEMAVEVVRATLVLDDEGLVAGIAGVGLMMADQPIEAASSPGSNPGSVGAALNGPVVQGTGADLPQAQLLGGEDAE